MSIHDMSEGMKQDFLAAFRAKFGFGEMTATANDDAAAMFKAAAWAWQASREAVVVELPKLVGFEGAYDSLRDHEFCPRMSDVDDADEVFGLCRRIEVQEAIEAQGLKVAP